MGKQPQVSATVSQELYDSIVEYAGKDKRTVSAMVAILLESAIKEKHRLRDKYEKKKVRIPDNPTDER